MNMHPEAATTINTNGRALQVAECPYCGLPHIHGAGDSAYRKEHGPEYGHRVEHCYLPTQITQYLQGYILVHTLSDAEKNLQQTLKDIRFPKYGKQPRRYGLICVVSILPGGRPVPAFFREAIDARSYMGELGERFPGTTHNSFSRRNCDSHFERVQL